MRKTNRLLPFKRAREGVSLVTEGRGGASEPSCLGKEGLLMQTNKGGTAEAQAFRPLPGMSGLFIFSKE